jgi:hypothetical protein
MSTMSDALRTIIAGSPAAASDAMDCLRAIAVKSPAVQQRYNHTMRVALGDPQAEFTAEQRALLAQFAAAEDNVRLSALQVRLSPSERQEVEDAARTAGLSLSEYIRARLFSE